MTRRRKWQSGSADLVSVAVGMVILSIAVTGTAAAMIYGRDIMARQEHYKAVAFMLKGAMEKKQWELVSVVSSTDDRAFRPVVTTETLNLALERGQGNREIPVTLVQEPVIQHYDQNGMPDYYYLTIRARWTEPDLAGGNDHATMQEREMKFTTAIALRS
jgi:hypothetical protein